ncbi:MAG: VanZ family protein [Chloroflexota bacterium]
MKLKTLTLLFAFLILLIIILADRDQLGFVRALNEIPLGDKVGHFILYGILSFLLNLTLLRSLPARDPRRLALALSLLLALAIGLEEWSQQFFPARTADWADLLFSYLGVAAGAWLAYKIPLSRNRERG